MRYKPPRPSSTLPISIATLAQNVRDLQRRPSGRRGATGMIHRSGLAGPRELQQVQRRRRGGCLVPHFPSIVDIQCGEKAILL